MMLDFDYEPEKLQVPPDNVAGAVSIYGLYAADSAVYEFIGSVSVVNDPKFAELMQQARKYQYMLAVNGDSDLIEVFKKAPIH